MARMDYLNRYERGKWRHFCFSPAGFGHAPLNFPEPYAFKEEIAVDVVLTREGGNAAVFLRVLSAMRTSRNLNSGV